MAWFFLCKLDRGLAEHNNHLGLVWLDACSTLVRLDACLNVVQLNARPWGSSRGARVVDHRQWITCIVWLVDGTCEFGVRSDHAWAGVRWWLYMRFCVALRSSAELIAYWWEGRRLVAAWFLSVILAGAGLCLGNGDLPVPECGDDHGKAGPGGVHPLGVCQGLTLLGVPRNLLIQLAQAVVDVDLELGQCVTVLGKNILEVGLDAVAKGGEVGDLHHYGLCVEGCHQPLP